LYQGPDGVKAEWSVIDTGKTEVLHVRVVRTNEIIGHWYPSNKKLFAGKKIKDQVPGQYEDYASVIDRLECG
jgi:hypothetical protein